LGEAGGAAGIEVTSRAEDNARNFAEGLSSFTADQAAADDGKASGTGRGGVGRGH
jgi:hypothetical protein